MVKTILQAITAHQEGKLEEAEHLYGSILKTDPTNLDANNNFGVLLNALGRLEESEIYLNKAIELKPDYAEAHYNFAILQNTLGRLDIAVVSYKKAIKLKSNYPKAYNNLGITLKSLGRLDESEHSYKKAIELKPDYVEAYHNLALSLLELQKLGEAEKNFKKTIELKPDYPEAYNNLGATLKALGRSDESEKNYKKAIELKPNYAIAYNNLAIIQEKLDKFDEAEKNYKKAIDLKPDYAEAYNNLGSTLLNLKKINEAEASYKKAIELKPDYLEAHDNLKMILNLKDLLSKFDGLKKEEKKNNLNQINENNLIFNIRKILNPFISNRTVEKELVDELYKIKVTELSQMKTGPFFGTGKTSNFYLFEEDSLIIKNLEKDLIKIIREVVKSDVYIVDSFFNIMGDGGGSKFHTHFNQFDNIFSLNKKKYSLQYYLSVGDQNSSNPGIFEMKDPDEKILPSNGMIVIIPADRLHSAIYSGKTDRVMIGVNFYFLI